MTALAILRNRELAARQRLSSFSGPYAQPIRPRVAGYEGMNIPSQYNQRRQAGFYGGFTGAETESQLYAFQGLLIYQLTITNVNAATRTFTLTPGNLGESCPGLIAQGAFNDTTGAAGLSGATTSYGTIPEFKNMYYFNPTALLAFKIKSDVEAQSEEVVNVIPKSPYRQLESKVIPLAQYNDAYVQNDKIVFANIVQYNVQLDTQSLITIPVVGTSVMKLTLFMGPIMNTSEVLANKVQGAL